MQHILLELKVRDNELQLDYELQTEKCSWSIFDAGGVEKSSGRLLGLAPHKIPLHDLTPDVYQLCVIDGDKLLNARFRKS